MLRSSLCKPGATFLALTLAWAGSGAARADNLDQKLLEHAPKIVEALHAKGYKNVGVLRFRAHLGHKADSFKVGAINGNLVQRLENALIINLGSDDKHALG